MTSRTGRALVTAEWPDGARVALADLGWETTYAGWG